jgi:Fic family protein
LTNRYNRDVKYAPVFVVSPRLLGLVEEIAALRQQVLGAVVQVAWIPRLQQDARVRNTHSSTAIEGNPLSEAQVRALAEGRDVPATSDRAQREVLNYFAGLRFIEQHARKRTVTRRDVLQLHAISARGVMDQGQPGEFRRIQVWVGRHTPPPPERIEELMAALLEWWSGPARRLSPVVSSGVLHYRFEEIHPFGDGNGRVGRLLALWELYRRGFDTHHIFAVDEYYWNDRPRYYRQLQAVRECNGDLTSWLEYTAEGLVLALRGVRSRIDAISAEIGPKPIVLRPRQEQLLRMLRDEGPLAPRRIWEGLGVSRQGAMDLLRPLLDAGLVKRIGTKKSGKYTLA